MPNELAPTPLSDVFTCRCGVLIYENWLGNKLVWRHAAQTDIIEDWQRVPSIAATTDDYIECLDGGGNAAPTCAKDVFYSYGNISIASSQEYSWTSWNDDEVRSNAYLLRQIMYGASNFRSISREQNIVRYEVSSMYVSRDGDRLMMSGPVVFSDLTTAEAIIEFHGTLAGPESGPKGYNYDLVGLGVVDPAAIASADLAGLRG